MPQPKIKWGTKELVVEVDLNESPLLLKAQLFELTSIPPERQKLIIRGKTIPDDTWNAFKVQDGTVIMLIGSAESTEIRSAPDGSQPDSLKDSTGKENKILPVGLRNLGNTCYMNSTLQCFKAIPELEAALKNYNPHQMVGGATGPNQRSKLITNSLKSLYNEMDRIAKEQNGNSNSDDISPLIFVHLLRQSFPQFNTQDERGRHQQQDANECFTELLRMISDELAYSPGKSEEQQQQGTSSAGNEKVRLNRFFEIEHEITIKCLEEEAKEEPQKSKENVLQMSCFLDQEVRYIQAGIKNKMSEEIEKNSEKLGRNAKYEKRSLISRLPTYLSIQMVRFFYKENKKISAKILKDIKFPIVLDMFDLCTPELQAKLKPARTAFKEYDDATIELMRKAKLAGSDDPKPNLKPEEFYPNSFTDDIGSNNSGFYELKGLITHQGRASNSGHYVSWIRVGEDDVESDQIKWVLCDDEDVSVVTEEQILKLSGGGDWHCAYVFIYGPKKIPILAKE